MYKKDIAHALFLAEGLGTRDRFPARLDDGAGSG
jgi:hypothetical protein